MTASTIFRLLSQVVMAFVITFFSLSVIYSIIASDNDRLAIIECMGSDRSKQSYNDCL